MVCVSLQLREVRGGPYILRDSSLVEVVRVSNLHALEVTPLSSSSEIYREVNSGRSKVTCLGRMPGNSISRSLSRWLGFCFRSLISLSSWVSLVRTTHKHSTKYQCAQ